MSAEATGSTKSDVDVQPPERPPETAAVHRIASSLSPSRRASSPRRGTNPNIEVHLDRKHSFPATTLERKVSEASKPLSTETDQQPQPLFSSSLEKKESPAEVEEEEISGPVVEALQDEIHALGEAVRERERILQTKKSALTTAQLSYEDAERAFQVADHDLAAAQEEFKIVETDRARLLPQYERARQNKDQQARAIQYKSEIASAELEIREAEKQIKELSVQLQEVSRVYKSERERRMETIHKLTVMLDKLRSDVEHKLAECFDASEILAGDHDAEILEMEYESKLAEKMANNEQRGDSLPMVSQLTKSIASPLINHANTVQRNEPERKQSANKGKHLLRCIQELSQEREWQLSHLLRYNRELKQTIDIKREKAAEITLESERTIEMLKATKDEEIRSVLLKFEDERQSLINEIQQIKGQNAKYYEDLHRTRLLSDRLPGFVGQKDIASTDAALSGSVRRRRDLATPTERLLNDKSKYIEKERQDVVDKIRIASAERQKFIHATRDLRKAIEAEETKYATTLRQLEAKIQQQKAEAGMIEKENKRLKEVCETLATALRTGYVVPVAQSPSA